MRAIDLSEDEMLLDIDQAISSTLELMRLAEERFWQHPASGDGPVGDHTEVLVNYITSGQAERGDYIAQHPKMWNIRKRFRSEWRARDAAAAVNAIFKNLGMQPEDPAAIDTCWIVVMKKDRMIDGYIPY